jgi:hypothetical protein
VGFSADWGKPRRRVVPVGKSVSVNDQFFLGEKLERAVAFHIDGVAKMAVGGRKHRNDAALSTLSPIANFAIANSFRNC